MRLSDFYDMAWCEYLIKCYAYERMNMEKWRMVRMIAYNARIGSHLNPKDPKSVPRTEEDFLPLDVGKIKHKANVREAVKAELELMRKEKREKK